MPRRVEIRIDLLGPEAPEQSLLGPTRVAEHQRHVRHGPLVVGVELDGAAHVLQSELVQAPPQTDVRQHRMAGALAVVELDGAHGQMVGLIELSR